MKRATPLFSLLALGLAACAPSQPAALPAPAAPPTAVQSAPAPEPVEVLATAPDHWWQLDAGADRVHGTAAKRAYAELLAGRAPQRTVVVAVIDSGLDDEHEDLDDVLWVNEKEIPGNRKDDDRNGYVDDIHGWNFIGGPDGRHVHQDTYESTRLYAELRARYEGALPDTLAAAKKAEYQRFEELRAKHQADVAEAEAQLEQMRNVSMVVAKVMELLRAELGTDSLTAEKVAAIQTLRPDLSRAKQLYLRLEADGITEEAIRDQVEALEGRLKYGLNPEFDPRPIVGDRYADASQRGYGNADVEGPSADHGTHVAGIIAAERANGVGVDGIAPAVRIMVLRAVPDGDERDKDIANAIRYAADNGAHIINMSFGKAYSPRKDVVDAAVRHAEARGVLLVHAAGNAGADLDAEPNFPTRTYADGGEAKSWIEVGASSWQGPDRLAAPFSNYGQRSVDVFAPGVDILSTVPESAYEANSGTSMAAPVVSGVAALLMAYYPELSAAEVKQIILDSAVRYPEQAVVRPGSEDERVPFRALSGSGGVVNAYEALRLAEERSRR